jgi:hypothetical protein
MHDYRDLVGAGFAVLCAALMLIAGLLFILSAADESRLGTEKEPPTKGAPPFSSLRQFEIQPPDGDLPPGRSKKANAPNARPASTVGRDLITLPGGGRSRRNDVIDPLTGHGVLCANLCRSTAGAQPGVTELWGRADCFQMESELWPFQLM